jgi:signal transduction histidine kinase
MDGTEIIIRSEIEDLTLSPTKHRFLCNSLKEGISNGLRHGGATAFWFELKQDGDKVEFLLSDNGKGFGKDFIMGFGLTSMRDRARTLGGEVYLESEEGEGVELRIQL